MTVAATPKYLRIEERPPSPRRTTRTWTIYSASSGDVLADVFWLGSWRQYVVAPDHFTEWSAGCLMAVVEFLAQVNADHKEGIASRRK